MGKVTDADLGDPGEVFTTERLAGWKQQKAKFKSALLYSNGV